MGDSTYNLELSGTDEIRHRIYYERNRVTAFTVQYEAQIEGQWYPVVRWDTTHGMVHRDTLDAEGYNVDKLWLHRDTLEEALQYAIADTRTRWRDYRAEFIGRMP